MLGFSSYSEAPISQATTSATALGYLLGNASVISSGTLLLDAEAAVQAATTSASTNVNILFNAQASTVFDDAVATLDINGILANGGIGSSTAVSSVTSTAGAGDVSCLVLGAASLTGLPATLSLSSLETVAITFSYQADPYARDRVLFVTAHDSGYTAHILPENRVVQIHKRQGDNTVHIAD